MHYLSFILLFQGEKTYIPKRKRWNRMNQAWYITTWLILCAFDWAYLKTTQWKVPKRRQKPHKPRQRRNNINRLHARGKRLIIVNESRTKRTKPTSRTVLFDTDTKAIGIDNRCSACISHDINDFVGPVHKSDKVISAFGGRQQIRVYKGTITQLVLRSGREK